MSIFQQANTYTNNSINDTEKQNKRRDPSGKKSGPIEPPGDEGWLLGGNNHCHSTTNITTYDDTDININRCITYNNTNDDNYGSNRSRSSNTTISSGCSITVSSFGMDLQDPPGHTPTLPYAYSVSQEAINNENVIHAEYYDDGWIHDDNHNYYRNFTTDMDYEQNEQLVPTNTSFVTNDINYNYNSNYYDAGIDSENNHNINHVVPYEERPPLIGGINDGQGTIPYDGSCTTVIPTAAASYEPYEVSLHDSVSNIVNNNNVRNGSEDQTINDISNDNQQQFENTYDDDECDGPHAISVTTATTINGSYITQTDTEYSIDNNHDSTIVNEDELMDMGLYDNDVLFGRGGHIAQHVGNQAWLKYRNTLYRSYHFADNNTAKRLLVEKLIAWVYNNNGRFMRKKVIRTRISSSDSNMIHDGKRRRFGPNIVKKEYYVAVTDHNRIYMKASQALREGVL